MAFRYRFYKRYWFYFVITLIAFLTIQLVLAIIFSNDNYNESTNQIKTSNISPVNIN